MDSWPAVRLPRLPQPLLDPPRLGLHDSASGTAVAGPAGKTGALWVCGITPYDATHLGHAATYLTFDLVVRAWRDAGREVHYAQNVTDVDDPLLERAAATGEPWPDLAAREVERFRGDMTALRVLPPTVYAGVAESIDLIAAMVRTLRERGSTYELDGDVYFPVAAAPGFGSIAHLDRESMLRLSAERGGDPERPGKKDPLDSLLWRAARPGEPAWDTPLGPGRPGWHVECAALAVHYLGVPVDVQGGGSDLAFPHHEFTAATAAAACGITPFARATVHQGMVGLDGEKMSKSKGNLVLVSELLREGADAGALRLALLAHHYRSDWEWTAGQLSVAAERLGRWRAAAAAPAVPTAPLVGALREALADDLDTPRALAAVDTWAGAALSGGAGSGAEGPGAREAVDALLGIAI